MCGRYSLTASPEEVAELFGIDALEAFPPRYNIAPTQPMLMIATGPAGKREGKLVRWGLIPSWVKEPADFTLLLNARSETIVEKPSFRNAMRHRRTLVPASGFYEWRRPADRKAPRQAFWVRPKRDRIVAFGGLMERWAGKDGSEIDTGVILTTSANAGIAPIHDRMPVVITPEHFSRWLDCKTQEPRDVADLLAPIDADYFEAIPVGSEVNRVTNDGPHLQQPVAEIRAAAPQAPKQVKSAARGKTKPADGQSSLF